MFHLYGLMIGLGVVAAWTAIERRSTDEQRKILAGAAIWVVAGSVIGARLYHLATDWQLYQGAGLLALVAIWNGGLGIYGALVGGLGAGAVYLYFTKRLRRNIVLQLLDLLAFGLPLGQAIGRWGNYFNHELFGLPTNLPWAIMIPVQFRPLQYLSATHFHPLFLYESLAMFLLWITVWRLTSSKDRPRFRIGSGRAFGLYLAGYGIVRFLLDYLRIDRAFWLGIPVGQAVSVLTVLTGLYFLFLLRNKSDTIQ